MKNAGGFGPTNPTTLGGSNSGIRGGFRPTNGKTSGSITNADLMKKIETLEKELHTSEDKSFAHKFFAIISALSLIHNTIEILSDALDIFLGLLSGVQKF